MTDPRREPARPARDSVGRRAPDPHWPPSDYPGWGAPTRHTDRTWTKAVAELPTVPAAELQAATDAVHRTAAAGTPRAQPGSRAAARHAARRAARTWHWPALLLVGVVATWVLSAVALGDEPHPAGAAASNACAGPSPRLRALYVRGDQQPDRHGQVLPAFKTVTAQLDALFERAGLRAGGEPVRFERDARCVTVIESVVVPQGVMTNAASITAALRKLGFGAHGDRFLYWYEADGCGIAPGNQRPGATEPGTGFAALGRDCWTLKASTSELLRALAH